MWTQSSCYWARCWLAELTESKMTEKLEKRNQADRQCSSKWMCTFANSIEAGCLSANLRYKGAIWFSELSSIAPSYTSRISFCTSTLNLNWYLVAKAHFSCESELLLRMNQQKTLAKLDVDVIQESFWVCPQAHTCNPVSEWYEWWTACWFVHSSCSLWLMVAVRLEDKVLKGPWKELSESLQYVKTTWLSLL